MLCAHTRISGLDGKKWGRQRGCRRGGKRRPGLSERQERSGVRADEIVPGVEVVEITVGGGHSMLALRSFQSVMKLTAKKLGIYMRIVSEKVCTTEG